MTGLQKWAQCNQTTDRDWRVELIIEPQKPRRRWDRRKGFVALFPFSKGQSDTDCSANADKLSLWKFTLRRKGKIERGKKPSANISGEGRNFHWKHFGKAEKKTFLLIDVCGTNWTKTAARCLTCNELFLVGWRFCGAKESLQNEPRKACFLASRVPIFTFSFQHIFFTLFSNNRRTWTALIFRWARCCVMNRSPIDLEERLPESIPRNSSKRKSLLNIYRKRSNGVNLCVLWGEPARPRILKIGFLSHDTSRERLYRFIHPRISRSRHLPLAN